jgi:hypothetical protein
VAGNQGDSVEYLSRTGTLSGTGAHCFGQLALTALSNPSLFGTVPAEPAWQRSDDMTRGGRVQASEDGKLTFVRLAPSYDGRGFSATDGSKDTPVDCVPDAPGRKREEYLLGWTGPRTVALAISSYNNADAADDWRTATLQADGSVICGGGIPATGRELSGIALSFDSQAILFKATGPAGPEKYRQPITGGEPVRAEYPDDPADRSGGRVEIYRAGPSVG